MPRAFSDLAERTNERPIMKNINECRRWIETHTDIVIDLVRMYLGVGLFVKGLYFMMHQGELARLLEGADNVAFAQGAVAHYVIPVHLVGGLLLAMGLLTRLAALAQIPILLGAIFYYWLPGVLFIEQRQNLEFSALVLFLLTLIFVYGSGRFSVDYLITKKESRQPQAHSPA
ncbi:MAG: DoxX family protein [Verrucomicrobia bacterium]|nr:MAG: DoxX family protein [Verrucomicrobiota bacterium]